MEDLAGAASASVPWTTHEDDRRHPPTGLAPGHLLRAPAWSASMPDPARVRGSWFTRYRERAVAVDIVAAAIAGVFTTVVPMGAAPLHVRAVAAVALPAFWCLALLLSHGYERRYLGITTDEYRAVAKAVVMLVVGVAVGSWLVHGEVARGVVLGAAPILLFCGLLGRHLLRKGLMSRRVAGLDTQRTVVIGNVRTVAPLIRQMRRAPR